MSSGNKKPVHVARKKIKDKLSEINSVATKLHDIVNNAIDQPCKSGGILLQEKSSKKFLAGYAKVNQQLESCLYQLLLMETALTSDTNVDTDDMGTDDEEDDDEEDEADGDESHNPRNEQDVSSDAHGTKKKIKGVSCSPQDTLNDEENSSLKAEPIKDAIHLQSVDAECRSFEEMEVPQTTTEAMSQDFKEEHSTTASKTNLSENKTECAAQNENVCEDVELIDATKSASAAAGSFYMEVDIPVFDRNSHCEHASGMATPHSANNKQSKATLSESKQEVANSSRNTSKPVDDSADKVEQLNMQPTKDRFEELISIIDKNSPPAAAIADEPTKVTRTQFNQTDAQTNDKAVSASQQEPRKNRIFSTSSLSSSKATSRRRMLRSLAKDVVLKELEIEAGDKRPVLIGEVYSPSKFYVQIVNEEYSILMEEMCILFAKEAAQGYKGGINHVPSVGDCCCAKSPLDDTWYRAIVTAVKDESPDDVSHVDVASVSSLEDPLLQNTRVDVLFVDQGNAATSLSTRFLRPLPEDRRFAEMPMQAACCMMGGIQPAECHFKDDSAFSIDKLHNSWSAEATQWLTDLVQSEDMLMAVFSRMRCEKQHLVVDLYLCNMADHLAVLVDDANLAVMMKQVEMASPCDRIPTDGASITWEDRSLMTGAESSEGDQSSASSVKSSSPIGSRYQWMLPLRCNGDSSLGFTFTNRYKTKDWCHLKNGFGKVVVSHVVSPSRFHVHLLTADLVDFDAFVDRLNVFYDEQAGRHPPSNEVICKGSAVIAKCFDDDRWCRGLVLEVCDTLADVIGVDYRILFVDYGTEEWKMRDALLPVLEGFFDFPIQTTPCCLADVHPLPQADDHDADDDGRSSACSDNVEGESERHRKWCKLTIEEFKELTLHGRPLVVSVKRPTTDDNPMALYVYDTSGNSDICINQLMVDQHLAASSVLRKHDPSTERGLLPSNGDGDCSGPASTAVDAWDPMAAEYESDRNRYNLNVDDAAVAMGSMVLSNRKICRFYAANKVCWRGSECPFDHSRPEDIPVQNVEVFCTKTITSIGLPEPDTWVAVTVTSFFNVTHFWVQFPLGTAPLQSIIFKGSSSSKEDENANELEALQENMRLAYGGKDFHNNSAIALPACGELLAARFSKDGLWYRARVIDVSEEQYKVFFIDYGNCETVKAKDTRRLLRDFVHLDAQAVECFLANATMVTGNNKFTTQAKDAFDELTADKVLVARVTGRYPDGILVLELFDSSDNVSINIGQVLAKNGYVTLPQERSK